MEDSRSATSVLYFYAFQSTEEDVFWPQHSHSNLFNFTYLSIFSPLPRRPPASSLFKLTSLLGFFLVFFFFFSSSLIEFITLCFVPKLLRDGFALPQMESCWFHHLLSHDSTYPILCKWEAFINPVIELNLHETRKKSSTPTMHPSVLRSQDRSKC